MKTSFGSTILVLALLSGSRSAQTPTLSAKLVGATSMAGDTQGTSVALSGNTAVVGAPPIFEIGSAYVYLRSAGRRWTEVAKLLPSDSASNDYFGYSVAIDGDEIAVGQANDNHGGSVHLFERNQGGPNAWGEVTEVFVGGFTLDLGWSVSLQGDRLASGDPSSTMAFVYERDAEGNWVQSGAFDETGGFFVSNFGWSVDLDGDWLVVGNPQEDGFSNGGPGEAFVYRREGFGNWTKVKKLTHSGSDGLGTSIDLDGDLLAVGAQRAVYLFDRNAGGANQWGLVKVINGSSGYFGLSVSVQGDRLLSGQDLVAGEHVVRLFERHLGGENAFGEVFSIPDPSSELFSFFGAASALDWPRLLVGSPYEDAVGPDSGAAYVFERPKIALAK